jgi:putative endonuclease
MYFLYLAECEDSSIYTGITTDVKRRLKEHQSGTGGKYTRAKKVKKILYTEKYKTRSQASKREAEIKKWRREEKLALISSKTHILP